jgi:hypothetical protein
MTGAMTGGDLPVVTTETPQTADAKRTRLAEGADRLLRGRISLANHPQLLLAVSATLMVFGVTAIIIGWLGAAHSTFVEEQVPYLISGGLLGVALATIGALTFFTHWLNISIREARQHEAARRQDHAELIETIKALTASLSTPPAAPQENTNGRARSTRSERPVRRAPRSS